MSKGSANTPPKGNSDKKKMNNLYLSIAEKVELLQK
jgi:hypothetical protein